MEEIEHIDLDAILNTVHVPKDAGEHEAGLRKIMSRIPPRWGRWISCDKGWYPLIIELDEKLAEICPNYEIHQVKEKFGTLRFYFGIPSIEPQCCIDIHDNRPSQGAVDPKWLSHFERENRTLQDPYDLCMWFDNYVKHLETEEHHIANEALTPERERMSTLYDTMQTIADEYENRSAVTCETTGNPGVMMHRGYWFKTLDPAHAPEGYVVYSNEDEDAP